MDFEHAHVVALCKKLWYPQKVHYANVPDPKTAKDFYIRAVELMTDGLHNNCVEIKSGVPESNFLKMGPRLK